MFYLDSGKLMAVDVKLGSPPEIGLTHRLLNAPPSVDGWAVFGDGQQFLFLEPAGEFPVSQDQRGVELGCRAKAMTLVNDRLN